METFRGTSKVDLVVHDKPTVVVCIYSYGLNPLIMMCIMKKLNPLRHTTESMGD